MGRGSGGVSFVQADAEMLFQYLALGRKHEEVELVTESGKIIQGAGESADPQRFTDGAGLFAFQNRHGVRVAISGSIQTPADRAHAIALIAAAARTVSL
jgi:hypothetical protein